MPRTIKNYPIMISVRVDREIYDKLQKLVKEKKMNRSRFIRELLRYALNRIELLEKTKI